MSLNIQNSYYEKLPAKFYSRIELEGPEMPELVIFNKKLALELGLSWEETEIMEKTGRDIFSGKKLMENSVPIAQAYAGHQFGYFTMLGDGRAVLLGEQITPQGKIFDIHLKGSGKTPYSRKGDGKAVLGPMLREYIISEAMHFLKIPTARSLAVVRTGETVYRESEKAGAVLTRTASSHIRAGTFQYASVFGSCEDLKQLADYTVNRHFPYILEKEKDSNKKYVHLLKEVIRLQAKLISEWCLKGFIHGVMNTDNMAVSGETIDYGPCAFMDIYHPETVFSSIDYHGRYSYGNQPYIALWNLTVFAESLYPLFDYTYGTKALENGSADAGNIDGEEAKTIIQHELLEYSSIYKEYWNSGMRKKLGLFTENDGDEKLFKELLEIMKNSRADYTNTFAALTKNKFPIEDEINSSLYKSREFENWKSRWRERQKEEGTAPEEKQKLMEENNPIVIPRNHIVEEALLEAEEGNCIPMKELLEIISDPYSYKKEIHEKYLRPKITRIPYQTYCGT